MLAVLPSMGVEGPVGGRAAAAGELEGPAGGRVAAAGDELAMALAWRTKGVDSHRANGSMGYCAYLIQELHTICPFLI